MTKISQKEYIDTLITMCENSCRNMIYAHMSDEMGIFDKTIDNERMINMIISDSIHSLSKQLTAFISENGIPRKQRSKKDETEKRKPSAYILFCHQHRENVKKMMPASAKAGDITKRLSEMWNALSVDQQLSYANNKNDVEEDCDDYEYDE